MPEKCQVCDVVNRTKYIEFTQMHLFRSTESENQTIEKAEQVLKSFGTFMISLSIDGNTFHTSNSSRLLQAVNGSCSENFKRLKCTRITFDAASVELYADLFNSLEEIVFDQCYGSNAAIGHCLAHSQQLSELMLIRMFDTDGLFLSSVANTLKTFIIKSTSNFSREAVLDLLARSPELKRIKIMGCNFADEMLYEDVPRLAPNAEVLSIRPVIFTDPSGVRLLSLLQLQKLRHVEVLGSVEYVTPFLNRLSERKSIEHFGISTFTLSDPFIDALSNLSHLKSLQLTVSCDTLYEYARRIAENLTDLEQLTFVQCNFFAFSDALPFVKYSSHLHTFNIYNCSNLKTIDREMYLQLVSARDHAGAQRSHKQALKIYLSPAAYTSSVTKIGHQLLRSHENVVRLSILPANSLYDLRTDYLDRYMVELDTVDDVASEDAMSFLDDDEAVEMESDDDNNEFNGDL